MVRWAKRGLGTRRSWVKESTASCVAGPDILNTETPKLQNDSLVH